MATKVVLVGRIISCNETKSVVRYRDFLFLCSCWDWDAIKLHAQRNNFKTSISSKLNNKKDLIRL